jgi:hypothetical protein
LFDEDNVGPNKPTGDDAGGNGPSSVETLAPNLIGSSSVGETYPLADDRAASTTPSGSGEKKIGVVLGTKHMQDKVVTDQVIIELPSYRGPRSPLDIVVVEHIFGCLFEAFQHISQAARTDTSTGDDPSHPK